MRAFVDTALLFGGEAVAACEWVDGWGWWARVGVLYGLGVVVHGLRGCDGCV